MTFESDDSAASLPSRRQFLRRTGALAAGLLVAPAILSACSSSQQTTQARMGITAGTQTLWRYIAQRKNELLEPLGHQVQFINYPSESALRQDFLQNQLDVIATFPTLVPSLAESGADVQYFLPIAWVHQSYPIIVPAESPVQTMEDLKGRRVATFPLSHPGFAYWRAFTVKNYGWRLEEFFTAIETDQPNTPLLGGQVDAAVVDGLAWGELRSSGRYRLVSDLSAEWQRISGGQRPLMYGGYVARRDWISRNRKFIDDFIRINAEALGTYRSAPNQVLEAAAAWSGENIIPLSQQQCRTLAAYFGYDEVPPERCYVTQEDVQDYETVFRLLYDAGYLSRNPDRVAERFYLSQPT